VLVGVTLRDVSARIEIPASLAWLAGTPEGRRWLADLPRLASQCLDMWALIPGEPFLASNVSLVVPVTRADGSDAVLKIQFPHRESTGEADALQLWQGVGAVQLLEHNPELHALLIERCVPGVHLASIPADEALDVVVSLLPRLWISDTGTITSLAEEAAGWSSSLPGAWGRAGQPFDRRLLNAATDLLSELAISQGDPVLLHQDLHGDNILSAQREPWLAIDPKPLAGEREFGVASVVRAHEFGHSREAVRWRLDRLVGDLGLDRDRATAWSFAATLAWSIEGSEAVSHHVDTARWLAERLTKSR